MDQGAEAYKRYIAGDDDGMADLVSLYRGGLILYLTTLVQDVYLAEELTEDTFFRLMVKKPHYRESGSFKAWLYAIARNRARDEWRRRRHLTALPEEQEAAVSSLEEDYLQAEQVSAVRHAMQKLPADYQQVLWLKIFAQFDNAEIARIMGKTRRQVEMLLYRAKLSLRAELEKEGFSYEN